MPLNLIAKDHTPQTDAYVMCRPNPQYTIMVDQFVNLPFPDWYYTFLEDNAAWNTESGGIPFPPQ